MRVKGRVQTRKAVPCTFSQTEYAESLRPDGSGEPAWQIKARAGHADILILDDLGAELDDLDARATRHVRSTLGELLDERYRRGGRTIVTTNLLPDEIRATFDERVYSRLRNHAKVLRYLGMDRRVPQQPEEW